MEGHGSDIMANPVFKVALVEMLPVLVICLGVAHELCGNSF